MNLWVEVDSAALEANVRAVAAMLGPTCRLCAVVKANAYGHGAEIAARAFLRGGAERLAVTTVEEGAELRAAGIACPILLLASHAPDEASEVLAHRLTPAISDAAAAERLAGERTDPVPVHLLIDVGMGRDGCLPREAHRLNEAVSSLPGLAVEGVFCHFPTALARDKNPTRDQLAEFLNTVSYLRPRPAIVHAANSAAAVDLPEARLDMARIGTLLYGQVPSRYVSRAIDLCCAWRLRARLVEVRDLPAGATVGYGSEVRLRRPTRVGTLLVGWQHGFTLQPASLARGLRGVAALVRSDAPFVTVAGARCTVLGRVAMQSCTVDLTAAPTAKVGDVADVPARRATVPGSVVRVEIAP